MTLLSAYLQCKVSTNLWINQSYWKFQHIQFDTWNSDESVEPKCARTLQHRQRPNLIVWNNELKTVLVENLIHKTILRIYKYTWKQNLKCLGNVKEVVACWTWTRLAESKWLSHPSMSCVGLVRTWILKTSLFLPKWNCSMSLSPYHLSMLEIYWLLKRF